MTHVRAQVREAIVTALNGATTAGTQVYGNRATKVAESALPMINVVVTEEIAEPATIGTTMLRTFAVDVYCYSRSGGSVDAALDALAVEVEDVMDQGLALSVQDVRYVGASMSNEDMGLGEIGSLIVRYEVRAFTSDAETFV